MPSAGFNRGKPGSFELVRVGKSPVSSRPLRFFQTWFFALLSILLLDVRAQEQVGFVLTNAAQLRALSTETARKELPVRLRAVVNLIGLDAGNTIFIQDETGGSFLSGIRSSRGLEPGSFIEVVGVTYAGLFVPGIRAARVEVLGQRELPLPEPASFDDLLSGRLHYQRVRATGVVRAVILDTNHCTLRVAMGARKLDVQVLEPLLGKLPALVDARVHLTGLAAGFINDKRQMVAPQLIVRSLADLKVEQPPPTDAFAAPAISVARLLSFNPVGSSGYRVKIQGVVTHQQPGVALFLRSEGRGLYVQTLQSASARPGEVVEVVGFPAMGTFSAMLEDAEFKAVGREPAPMPVAATVRQVLSGTNDANLVTLEAQLLETLQTPLESVLVLRGENTVFNARVARAPLDLAVGSRLRLTGVCRVEESSTPGTSFRANPRAIELRLRSPEDIAVLSAPAWWNAERLSAMAGGLLVLLVAAFAWAALLRRRVTEQTEVIREKVEREAVLAGTMRLKGGHRLGTDWW